MAAAAENVKTTLKKITLELDDVEHRREILIKGTRDVIIKCSKSIMALHRGRFEDAAKLVEEAHALSKRTFMKTLKGTLSVLSRNWSKHTN
jgi:translin